MFKKQFCFQFVVLSIWIDGLVLRVYLSWSPRTQISHQDSAETFVFVKASQDLHRFTNKFPREWVELPNSLKCLAYNMCRHQTLKNGHLGSSLAQGGLAGTPP